MMEHLCVDGATKGGILYGGTFMIGNVCYLFLLLLLLLLKVISEIDRTSRIEYSGESSASMFHFFSHISLVYCHSVYSRSAEGFLVYD